ncbi:serine/threonine-protein kinase [Amnibacterium sp.]|uniref:serine/threonine-protein kinase n=1 Tax=Amnibacterium sp. TaxID=1872496 RepID=UPI002618D72A|nr:serine/threonine-protein kinase [Amnibacterium sp.]MCU1474143.1 serine/threonine protein kinase [Amnibacterium sp.]
MTAAPEIDGYEFLQPLGSGGFADVYLYEQEMPRRSVAVKVLRGDDLSSDAVATFRDEANLMAQLSAHPAIVTVHVAGVLPDERPFLVMEHCPRPNLGQRFRVEALPVDEVLAIGIQIAGAVETAHRAGVLHRDIKPANILVTSFNRPALADFGIAATLGRAATGDTLGMSVPWSPPETLDGSWSGPATDVYMLGATVYSLLGGRAPFESAEGANDVETQAARIRRDPVPPTGRPDVPASLERALQTAMAKTPQGRYTSALSFARALQKVQRELGLAVTTVDVLDNSFTGAGGGLPGDESLTLGRLGATGERSTTGSRTGSRLDIGPVATGVPAAVYIAPAATGSSPAVPSAAATGTASRPAIDDSSDHTMLRGRVDEPAFGPAPTRRRVLPGIVVDVVLVLGVAAAATALVLL